MNTDDRKKILVVEDDPHISKLIKIRLEAAGFKVFCAYDGYQGIDFAVKKRPDLIILDWMMPAGGGESVLGKVRINTEIHHTPVVILTAIRDEDQKNAIAEGGISAYFQKPYDPQELTDTIRKILSSEGDLSPVPA